MRIINLQIATFSMKYTSIGLFQFLKKTKKKNFVLFFSQKQKQIVE